MRGIFSALIMFNCYSTVVTCYTYDRVNDFSSLFAILIHAIVIYLDCRIIESHKIDIKMLQDFSLETKNFFHADYNASLQGFSCSCVLEHSTETIN